MRTVCPVCDQGMIAGKHSPLRCANNCLVNRITARRRQLEAVGWIDCGSSAAFIRRSLAPWKRAITSHNRIGGGARDGVIAIEQTWTLPWALCIAEGEGHAQLRFLLIGAWVWLEATGRREEHAALAATWALSGNAAASKLVTPEILTIVRPLAMEAASVTHRPARRIEVQPRL